MSAQLNPSLSGQHNLTLDKDLRTEIELILHRQLEKPVDLQETNWSLAGRIIDIFDQKFIVEKK